MSHQGCRLGDWCDEKKKLGDKNTRGLTVFLVNETYSPTATCVFEYIKTVSFSILMKASPGRVIVCVLKSWRPNNDDTRHFIFLKVRPMDGVTAKTY